MIVKVFNNLETKLLSKTSVTEDEQVKEVYHPTYGTLVMKHYIKNNIVVKSEMFNAYGDIIAFGHFVNNRLHGNGCMYKHVNHQWIRSPHFMNGSVFGLAAVFDVNHDIIFYGWMFDDKMVKEELIYHPYLRHEYSECLVESKKDKAIITNINRLLDS